MKVLVTETIAEAGLAILRNASDIDLDYRPGLKGDELLRAVAEADGLITRSGTAVTPELVAAGAKLRVVGRAGVGLDNVDVDACTARGILVINAPTANVMSATEHTMAMLLALCRNIAEAHASVKRGEWTRAKFMGTELNGKTLGIIGLGRIGKLLTARAKAFGMHVIACDPYIAPNVFESAGAQRASLDELLAKADVITVHTPLTEETHGMLGAAQIAKMKDGVIALNIARGGIWVEQALADALNSGKIAGAAIDVYEKEPPGQDHPLLNAKNIVLSPHIGANTMEAQDRVAVQTAENVVEALRGSIFVSAVNLPFEGVVDADDKGLVSLAEKLGLFAAQIIDAPVARATIETWAIPERLHEILTIAAIKGVLEPRLVESVNFVNAKQLAQERGIDVDLVPHETPRDYRNLISFRAGANGHEVCVSGTLFSEHQQRIVSVDQFRVEFRPEGQLLYIINNDVPGVVGRVGTLLGEAGVNIAEYNLARNASGGTAMSIVSIDSALDPRVVQAFGMFPSIREVKQVKL
ncbi:MAG TPA: phosphoglycerate dehydrogenase [Thermoanaerobaculia bacterium]|nr:phosphoglycerate dehydrogenase [Thermoanaerobaculia bacterium]